MRNFDLTPYRRSTIGFDRLFDFLENASRAEGDNYPPFDLEKIADDRYRITLAVAGFKPEEIDITARQNLLTISGRKGETRGRDGRTSCASRMRSLPTACCRSSWSARSRMR